MCDVYVNRRHIRRTTNDNIIQDIINEQCEHDGLWRDKHPGCIINDDKIKNQQQIIMTDVYI